MADTGFIAVDIDGKVMAMGWQDEAKGLDYAHYRKQWGLRTDDIREVEGRVLLAVSAAWKIGEEFTVSRSPSAPSEPTIPELKARIAELEARVAELTEWRTMDESTPKNGRIFIGVNRFGIIELCWWNNYMRAWIDHKERDFAPVAWLPLPAPPATPDREKGE